ncbi:penicillin-binding protein 2 [Sulfurospirillum arcachonense]|uniref:penicillin-binding protein 2 n=1 Tax=Sulfurospirillum arcachonense TaxID=57666 RepID=UPI0004BB3248|nr:penicillin-binding protein 2 [Sulfurospirillum arcachonense]
MRIKLLLIGFTAFWLVLLVRIYYISIKSNTYYEEIAKQNAIKVEDLAPSRGSILDTNGKPLSVNKLGFSIGIKPQLSSRRKRETLDKEINFLVNNLKDLDSKKIKKIYLKRDSPYSHEYVKVIDFISYDDVINKFSKLSLRDNLKINIASKRYYPYNELASHVIGYVAKANIKDEQENRVAKLTGFIGRTGIEKYYNSLLEGEKGQKRTKVTAFNEELEEIDKTLPSSSNIKLSLDLELQQYIAKLFEKKSGAIIVMNARNGQILAAGSFPEYNLNQFVSGISQKEWQELANDFNHPFTNKLINGLYPPGSVVKMGVGLALLESGLVTPYTSYYCSGSFELGGRKFRCWKTQGHGKTSLKMAIRESCDDYFYKGSLKIGIDRIAPVLKNLGFARKTGVDLPFEFIGSVPGRMWKMQKYQKPWYQGETLITSIGQGYFLTTPLQVAKYTALLATGYSITPHFIKSVDGLKVDYGKEDVLTYIEKRNLPLIRKAMREVISHPRGTGHRYIKSKVDIAGKTGTAQVVGIPQSEKKRMKENELEYYHRSHAWFTTYGPYKDPEYVITAMIEHGGHGGAASGEIISKVYDKLLKMGYINK